jgi:glycosyltransferase involved in cell wall biosynthesis
VESLNAVDKKFKVLIAGSGPGKDKFLAQLMSLFPKNRIMYLGYLSQLELQNTWKSVGVLVSTAPVESYGRVLRESLIAGVPVWATESSGVLDLLNVADPGTVKLLDLNKDTVKLIEEFELLLDIKVGSKFRNKFVKDNNSYALKLASSWVETIENSKR